MSEITNAGKEELEQRAEKLGCRLVETAPDLLLVDLDDHAGVNQRVLALIDATYGIGSKRSYTSRNGSGRHVVIKLKVELSEAERLLLQCALGSDPMREALGMQRMRLGLDPVSALFEPKDG